MSHPSLHPVRPRSSTLRQILCIYSFLLACFAPPLFAQPDGASRAGRITGVVSNQATGDLLAGALIEVEGTSIRTVSARGGAYELAAPAGPQTLVVKYSGLDTARASVAVDPGSAVVRDVQLTSDIYMMAAVTVAGVREGNAQAIQTQRMAENPKWVAAIDTFGNPAANPGELIQRMPGVTTDIVGGEVRTITLRGMSPAFSSLLVDGEQMASSTGGVDREYQIEQFGTGNLESVEVIKAPLPDQDANAVAGYINLVSRRAFDAPGRRITLNVGTMWRDRRGVSSDSPFKDKPEFDQFSIAYSDVYSVLGKEKNLGVALNFSRRVSSTTQDEVGMPQFLTQVGQGFLNGATDNPLQRRFGMGDFVHPSTAQNSGLSLEYKLSPDAYVFARFSYNTNNNTQRGYRFSVGNIAATAAQFAPGSTYEHSVLLPHAASQATTTQWPSFSKNATTYSARVGTEFKLLERSVLVSLLGSYSNSNISYPGTVNLGLITRDPAGIGFEIDRRGQDPWHPAFRQTAGASVSDPRSYHLNTMSRAASKGPNEIAGLRLDVTKTFAGSLLNSVKTGIKYNDNQRSRTSATTNWTFVGADNVAGTADDSAAPYVDLLYKQGTDHYGPFPFVTRPFDVPEGYWKTTAAQAYTDYANSKAADMRFKEEISAAYVQARLRLGKLGVLTGVRVEQTEVEGTAWARNTTASWGGSSVGGASLDPAVIATNISRAERSFLRRDTNKGKYTNVFPGLHFTYRVTDSLLARASYNRSIARQPVTRLVAAVTENPDSNPPTLSMGNPGLKPHLSDNFELNIERYFEPVGLFSVGVFLKEISNYSRSFTTVIGPEGLDGGGEYIGYNITRQENVGAARVRGLEASYQQQFSFLPGMFRGLGALANFTYLETEGNFGSVATTRQLARMAPRSGNVGVNFRYRGLDARLLLNWMQGMYLGSQQGIDIYNDERRLLDLKLQYTFQRRYDVYLDVTNLTNEPTTAVITKSGLSYYKAEQGVLFSAGIRARF